MSPSLKQWIVSGWTKLAAQVGDNRRLQAGLACIVAIALLYGFLRASDAIEARQRKLLQTQAEIKKVSEFTKRPLAVTTQAERLGEARARLERRLGGYATEAIAQAAMAEWLTRAFKRLDLPAPTLSPVAVQAANRAAAEGSGLGPSLRELRTVVSFPYSPAALLTALSVIEGESRLTIVNTLSVTPTRVEIGLSVLTRVGPEFSGQPEVPEPEWAAASSPVAQPTAGQSAPVATLSNITHKILWN